MACCSSHSIKKLARIGDTGLPMAVPNFCLNNCPLKLKYFVVAINSEIHYIINLSLGLFVSLDLDLYLGVLL